ncbi:uncharacterized protein LOC116340337 [Contarinia nasturtii]|uniref:uncharacterized protein LOC116340337 n=1 Tax=Contarinia nasturtii TaxID=265458 RepID=UPI0012D3D230|nr:uncharacterized protein LOC116340337 [Contarinia nasturtii]XP_031622648.1 uncharacterized protein LOC116340337 [Contarinia nasturtii]XP_031622649.1 uncharacterized protein LOC116340337 [Contarinia nasturtii]
MEVKVIGEPCGYHGPYTFYKGIRISPFSSSSSSPASSLSVTATVAATNNVYENHCFKENNCFDGIDRKTAELLRSNDTIIKSIKHEYDSESSSDCSDGLALPQRKFNKTDVKPRLLAECYKKPLVLALGDCIPVRPWSDSPIACIAELRMVWRDKNEQCLLTSLRLYFLPENTPIGRNCHGEDEVLAISERVVIRADDLLNWCDDTINWTYGLRANTLLDPSIKTEAKHDVNKCDNNLPTNVHNKNENDADFDSISTSNIRSLKNSKLNFTEVEKEKETYSRSNVAVISFPRYCRYRATLKRLEGVGDEWLRQTLVQALCGFVSYGPDTRVMFCKETFDYPELETHELLCNHLAPKLKGRPRGRRKKVRSDSPSSRIRCDSAGSDSCDSEISACSVEKVYSKYSPLYVKPEFKQGKQVLATRPKLRYNPRPARTKLKSESADGIRSSRRATNSDSSDSNDSDSNTNTTNQDDDENESSEESEFIQKLIGFHEAQDSQIPKVFWIGLRRVNLLSIYQKVRKMGGYEMVTERKMWKYLFGVDGGYNSISRKKYERALLPYEKYEMRKEYAERCAKYGKDVVDRNSGYNFEQHLIDGNRRLTEAEILEIQRQIKLQEARKEKDQNLHVDLSSGSLPVTVIVGNKKSTSPSQFQIQQPHTTITVHQTTIHPQSSMVRTSPPNNPIQITNQIQIQQFTVQPGSSKKDDGLSGKRKFSIDEYSARDANFVANHLAKLGKTTSLRQVRLRPDRQRDRKSGVTSPPSIGSITVSAIKPNEKENIPYLSGSKTTTITPILGNSNKSLRYPNSMSDVIDLDSDNEDSQSPPQSHLYSGGAMFPNMKKRKLDILRQGGLEVTAISNSGGPVNNQSVHGSTSTSSAQPVNVSKVKTTSKINASLTGAHIDVPLPKFQSQCMYKRTTRIFGNPKDLIPLPTQTTEYNCIDLTVEKCEPQLPIGLRLPQSTTIQKAHSTPATVLTTTLPTAAQLAAQKITDPNLQITLVPPISHAHNSHAHHHNNKRKSSDNNKTTISGLKLSEQKIPSLPPSITTTPIGNFSNSTNASSGASSSASPPSTLLNVPNLSSINDNLKINQLLLQNFLNQSAVANAQSDQLTAAKQDPSTNPFLMLDPMYLTGLYNNPNLFFQQSLPQELLQLYKNFPQGLGIIPISKS